MINQEIGICILKKQFFTRKVRCKRNVIISPGIPQTCGVHRYTKLRQGVYCRGGDWGDRGRVLHNFSSYRSISHKSICLRKKAFIKELMDTYKSIVHFPVFANTSTQFRWSGQVWRDRVFMIKYQDKSLVYCHIYFTIKPVLVSI